MHDEHFEQAVELLRTTARSDTCRTLAYQLASSPLVDIGRVWEFSQSYDRQNLELYYEQLLRVAKSSTPFREPARRLLVPGALDFWLKQAGDECSYLGVVGPCLEAQAAIVSVAADSPQAHAVADIIAREGRVDLEMTPIYRKARGILLRRARRCMELNGPGCDFVYKNPPPGSRGDSEEEDIPDDRASTERLPSGHCPSWRDRSPATRTINARWEALLAKVPYEGRRRYLANAWISAANNCKESRLVIPWEHRHRLTK
jgi:hypothetical protein